MPSYRYILADLLTNTVIGELPFESVTFGSRMGKAGNFQASFGLNRSGYTNDDILSATTPGRTAVYIERTGDRDTTGALVWGGIIWSRTWQEQSWSLQFTGQSFESFAYQCDLRTTLDYSSGIDQRAMLINFFSTMQAMPSRNIGITLPAAPIGVNFSRSPIYYDYEAWTFGKMIDNINSYNFSMDYYIGIRYNAGVPEKYLVVDDVLGSSINISQLQFDYPGNINNYWWPENASRAASSINAIGSGEGSAIVRAVVIDTSKLAQGYPDITQMFSDKDTADQTVLINQAQAELYRQSLPITIPTFQLNASEMPEFGSYQMGDYAKFTLESPRWALEQNGVKEFTSRIIGWDVTPTRSDSIEEVKLILTGQD